MRLVFLWSFWRSCDGSGARPHRNCPWKASSSLLRPRSDTFDTLQAFRLSWLAPFFFRFLYRFFPPLCPWWPLKGDILDPLTFGSFLPGWALDPPGAGLSCFLVPAPGPHQIGFG